MDPISDVPKKKGRGRRKIPMERIQHKAKRAVTFSKRRTNLFKQAADLCKLCGSEVAIVAFSEDGRPFTFGHPDPDSVIKRYLNRTANPNASTRSQSVDHMRLDELQQYAKSLELELLKINAIKADLSNKNCNDLKWGNQDVYYAIDCEEGYVDNIFMPSSSPFFAPNNQNVDAANTSVLQQVQDGMDLYAEVETWFAD